MADSSDFYKKNVHALIAATTLIPTFALSLALVVHASVVPHVGVYISVAVLVLGSAFVVIPLKKLVPRLDSGVPDLSVLGPMAVVSLAVFLILFIFTNEGKDLLGPTPPSGFLFEAIKSFFGDNPATAGIISMIFVYLGLFRK